ncbi:unnamed protein product, partial [Lampetra planeri]
PYEESEERWFSSIENSRWLEYVRAFLKHSAEIVFHLDGKNSSVILQEEEDRDLNCVVSSLVQLMLDPHYRSLVGFQSLVQKEWVMAGHRFLDRCNHLKKNDKEDFARNKAIPQGEDQAVYFPPVWDWSQQFSLKDQTLFNNPMYVGKGAACVQNGEVKTFRRTKKYNSTYRGNSATLRNGLKGGEETLTRRGSLLSELRSDFSPVKDVVESPSERFFRGLVFSTG